MVRPPLYEYFESSANLLLSEYDRSKLQHASANLGANRELFCSSFLTRVLPPKLKVVRGEALDSKGNRTGQLDTIIIKDDVPSLEFGNNNSYLAESLFSVIEVKSNLTRTKLQEAIKTLQPVRNLMIHQEGLSILGFAPDNILDRPLLGIFAYEGASWDVIGEEINNNLAHELIDIICILSRGVLFKKNLWFQQHDDDLLVFNILNGKAAALGMLYFFLSTFSSSFIARNVSVRPYFEPFQQWAEDGKWIGARRGR